MKTRTRVRLALLPLVLASLSLLPAACEPIPAKKAGDLWVRLPAGESYLSDIGIYRIGYQLYGEEPVFMPLSWSGHFTDDVGIAFTSAGVRDGKRTMLLHCPWRRGTGAAFVEYFLHLPDIKPVTLVFSITMRPDITDKSDGVTFTVSIESDGEARRLVHEHYAGGKWKDFEFDLSRFAGKKIILKLQTEPGPAKNAGFDFSLFGDAKIVVGAGRVEPKSVLKRLTDCRAYRASLKRDLVPLANRPGAGIAPSCNDDFKNRLCKTLDGYDFIYEGDDCKIVYHYAPKTGALSDITVRVDGTRPFGPCDGGGVFFGQDKGTGRCIAPQHASLVSQAADGETLKVVWRYQAGDLEATIKWEFEIESKALLIQADTSDRTIGSFRLGGVGRACFCRKILIPYLYHEQASYLPEQNVFVMRYLDWTESNASTTPGGEGVYLKRLDGVRNPLHESGYVAVSPELPEVLPNIPHPPSPFLKLLGPKIMLDIWGGRYEDDAELLREYKSLGIDEAAIIMHVWQCYGYDVKLPDHLPANERLGGDKGMKEFGKAARECGYVFSLHENYIDFYPDAPSYNPKDVVLNREGKPSKAWYNKGTKVQSFGLKAMRALHYASQNSPEIHRRFGTTAAYLDVHTCTPPWHQLDFDATQPMAAMHKCRERAYRKLFQYMRDTHEGPLFGEGSRHFFWAGLVDGVEAQVQNGENCHLLVDFDLLKLHPQMVNHGMGYYTRWLRTGRETKWGVEAPTPEQMDKYRAMELAFGHAGFIGSQILRAWPLVWREYNLVAPVQALYGTAKVKEIRYEVLGEMVTSSVAAAMDDFGRVRVEYDSGLTVHVNMGPDAWRVGRYSIPQYGFLATAPDMLAYTAGVAGVIADYAETARTLYADSRTEVYRPWERNLKDIRPSVKTFKDLGNGKFEITYQWTVNEPLERDYTCFVHFCNENAEREDGIVFQDDHDLKTSKWRAGTVIADGPRALEIPAGGKFDTYDILIGLYERGGRRVRLKGVSAGGDRIIIGRVKVGRKDDKTVLRLVEPKVEADTQEKRRRAFDARMNVAGKTVDFGKVATNGAFRLYKQERPMRLIPYPRDREFTIRLNLGKILGKAPARCVVTARDRAGKKIGRPKVHYDDGVLNFETGLRNAAEYLIEM